MTTVWYLLAATAVAWVGMILTAASLGGLLFVMLAALFVGLKLTGIIAWSGFVTSSDEERENPASRILKQP